MKKILTLILLLLCTGLGLFSCEKNEVELDETTFTITIPNMDGTTLTLTNAYPIYFQPMSGDGEVGEPYWFVFKEGGAMTSDKPFSLYTAGGFYIDGNFIEREDFSFGAGKAFILETTREYSAFGYSDGHISSEYEKTPAISLLFSVVSEEEYKIMLEEPYKYGKNYPLKLMIN